MAIINIVVPPIQRDKFSGGMLCVLQYAKGLKARGHRINVVPLLPSPAPRWFAGDIGDMPRLCRTRRVFGALRRLLSRSDPAWHEHVWDATTAALLFAPKVFSPSIQSALGRSHVRALLEYELPAADVTLATSYQTALPVHLYGTGKKFYFAQHYEPYFSIDSPDPQLAELEAEWTYRLPLRLIANSSWLKGKLLAETSHADVSLCPNAIDLEIFQGQPKTVPLADEVKIISYGGRDAQWKGFRDMAEAMRLARDQCPDKKLRWLVYGSAMLPPNNQIAPYEALGFLQSPQLAAAYRSADIFLSASWYESFPLFPLEAMSCGLPIITTPLGTEEYAQHRTTAEIVEARNAHSIAAGILRLVRQPEYRASLAVDGCRKAREFSWESSVATMERILLS